MEDYIIPHNYKDNGRTFNLFDKQLFKAAMWWLIPSTVLLFNLPMKTEYKIFLWIILIVPPTIAILAGVGNWILYIVRYYTKFHRIYYSKIQGGGSHGFLYPKLERQLNAKNH